MVRKILSQDTTRKIRFRYNSRTSAFLKSFFPKATLMEWNDWRWQQHNRIRDLQALGRILKLTNDEKEAILTNKGQPPLAVTPYYTSLLEENNPTHPLRRTVVPGTAEQIFSDGESEDPLGENDYSPVPGLVHRYPDRVLFLVTDLCFTYCRYCMRSRLVGGRNGTRFTRSRWESALSYIESNRSVRDILLSGGDPLTLPEEALEWLLNRLRRIRHVELIRIGTKAPVVVPQRITPSLARMLKKFHPLWMSIHFVHPEELTPEVNQACERLADAGIPLGSQTVLLSGINDDLKTVKSLFHGLLKIRVKPYYLFQCDPIIGSAHFRTPLRKGLEIIQGLQGHTSGYAVPMFAIEAPGGGGKIPMLPEYVIGREGKDLLLRNFEGKIFRYPDDRDRPDKLFEKRRTIQQGLPRSNPIAVRSLSR
jgi:lysine 2,3-aminomutase